MSRFSHFSKAIICGIILCSIIFLSNCSGTKKDNSESSAENSATEAEKEQVNDQQERNQGIGPIKDLYLAPVDNALAEEGKVIFEQLCVACHKANERFIGPPMTGVTNRREPEWIMNMIINPQEMLENDPIAIELLAEFNGVPMVGQNISEENARKLLEYFRTL